MREGEECTDRLCLLFIYAGDYQSILLLFICAYDHRIKFLYHCILIHSPIYWRVWCQLQFSSGQLLSRVRLFVIPWTAACQASLSIMNWSPPKPMSIDDAIQPSHPCHPLLLPSIFPSVRIFSGESALRMSWPKYWSFSFSIIPSEEIPGLISFRMDWLDLLAVLGKGSSDRFPLLGL